MKGFVQTLAIASGMVLSLALTSQAAAALALNPVSAGASVTVTGTGSKANGPVELLVNDQSRGYVVADGTGNFLSFTNQNIAGGDSLVVQAAQVWNFNTNGDFEGWVVASGDPTSVAGGVWSIGPAAGVNITLNLDPPATTPAILDTTLTKVFEMRYRIIGAFPGDNGTVIYDPGSGFQFGNNLSLQANASGTGPWITGLVDMTVNNFGNPNTYASTGVSLQLAPGSNGFTAGVNTLEVDYIRMREDLTWNFNDNGDFMNWGPNPANSTAVVSGGKMALTNTIAGTNAQIAQIFQPINGDEYPVLETRVQCLTSQVGQLEFFNYFSAPPTPGGVQGPFSADGTYQVKTTNLKTTVPAFGSVWATPSTLNFPAGNYQPFFPPLANETANIDYLRLRGLAPYGPSAAVVAGSSVSDWGLY